MKIRSAVGSVVLAVCALGGTAWAQRSINSSGSAGGELSVRVTDLGGSNGQVFCALFDSARGYPTHMDGAFRETRAQPQGGEATCRFNNVPAGTYAVSAFYDANGNGRLDRHFSGAPKEPVAASNDAGARNRGPRFDDASFRFDGSAATYSVRAYGRR